jgi:hypothetical protein
MTRAKNHKAPEPVSFTTYLERQEYMQRVLCTSIAAVLKVTMLALAFRCNVKTKQCNPNQETLSLDTGLSLRSIQNYIAELKRAGLLTIKQSGDGKSANYTLFEPPPTLFQPRNVAAGLNPTQKTHSAPKRGGGPVQPRKKGGSAPQRVYGQTVEQKEGGIRPRAPEARATPPEPQAGAAPQGLGLGAASNINEASIALAFAAFAQAYPKKTGMGAARPAFTEACSIAESNYIVARAALYAKDFQGSRAQYAIAPTKWSEDRCYNDPLPDGVTTEINNNTGELTFVRKAQPQRNGYENPLYQQMEQMMAECDEENGDGAIH